MNAAARVFERAALLFLFAFVAWGPLAQGSTFAGGRAGLTVLGALTGSLWLASAALAGRLGALWRSAFALALLGLLAWTGLSVARAPDTFVAVQHGALFAAVLLASLAAQGLLTTPARRLAFGRWLLGVAVVTAAYVVAQRLGWRFSSLTLRTEQTALSGFYYHPSHYTGFVTLALAVCAWACTSDAVRLVRWLAAVCGLVLALSLAWTNSASMPTALLAGAFALILGLARQQRGLAVGAGALLLAGVLTGGWLLASERGRAALDRAMGGIQTKSVDRFLYEREVIWTMDAQAARAAPISGVGPGHLVFFLTRFRPERADGANDLAFNFVNYAHSDYYQLAVELGRPGLLLYLALMLALLLSARRQDPLGAALLAALGALWISGIWDSHMTVVPGTMAWAWAAGGVVAGRAASPASLATPPTPTRPKTLRAGELPWPTARRFAVLRSLFRRPVFRRPLWRKP